MMRYVALAVGADYWLRDRGNGTLDFNGEGFGPETIWLREVVDDRRVRLRNLAHQGYLAPSKNPASLESYCRTVGKNDPLSIWIEVPTGDYYSYQTAAGRFLTAMGWVGFGSKSGESGCNATTFEAALFHLGDQQGDHHGWSQLISLVPPERLLPWPGNGPGSVEEYIERKLTDLRNIPVYSGMSREQREQLARELQLTIQPERIVLQKPWLLTHGNDIDVSGNVEH
jgi:hypothetical protein